MSEAKYGLAHTSKHTSDIVNILTVSTSIDFSLRAEVC